MSKDKSMQPEEKVNNVRKWKAVEISIRAASRGAGVDPKTIQRWPGQCEAEGAAAFLPRRKNRVYPPEIKRQTVREYLSGAGSLREISKKYQLRSDCQLRERIKVYNAHGDFNSVKCSGD